MKTLILRCEASVDLGTGHLMRCIALAQEWEMQGHRALFALSGESMRFVSRSIAPQIKAVQIMAPVGTADDALETAKLADVSSAYWVAVDGFGFGSSWHLALPGGLRLLRIGDDSPHFPIRANAILNSDPGATPNDYPAVAPGCAFLLGCKYTMLRQEFCAAQRWQPHRSHILVTMGGTDPAQFTSVCLNALQQPNIEDVPCEFLIGPGNPNREALERNITHHAPRLYVSPAGRSVPEIFASATWAMTAGGTTIHELAFLGVPMLIVATAENQVPIAKQFAHLGAAQYLGSHEQLTPERLAKEIREFSRDSEALYRLSKRAMELVDGQGARRVVERLLEKIT